MPTLTREEVRAVVDTEARFAQKWDHDRPLGSMADADKPIEVWLGWMQVYIQESMRALVLGGGEAIALNNLRCVLNLGETCAQYHGLPKRVEGDRTDLYGFPESKPVA